MLLFQQFENSVGYAEHESNFERVQVFSSVNQNLGNTSSLKEDTIVINLRSETYNKINKLCVFAL